MSKLLRVTSLVAMLCAALPAAQAATHDYNFSGTMDSGAYNGSSFAGNFSYDDTTGTADWIDVVWYQVTSLSFSFLGSSYTLGQADLTPEVAFHNGQLFGLSSSFSAGDPQLAFVTAYPGMAEPAYLSYDTAVGLSGAGTVIYAPVPEPASAPMLLAGLGLLGVLASRRMKVS